MSVPDTWQGVHRLARTARARRHLRCAQNTGDLTTATNQATRAVADLEAQVAHPGGPSVMEVVAALHTLAALHRAAFNLPAAITTLDRAAATLDRAGDATQLRGWVCETLTVRGDTRRLLGDHTAAASDLTTALAAAPDPVLRAGVCNALGILAKDTGCYDDADTWYSQALQVTQAQPNCAALAAVLHNLAGLDHARGNLARGEQHIRRALHLRAALPADQPALLADQGVLVALLAAQRRDDEAEPLLRTLIAAWTRLRGPDHYEVAHCQHHLGVVHARHGRSDEARTELTAALTVFHRIFGAQHPDTISVRAAISALPS